MDEGETGMGRIAAARACTALGVLLLLGACAETPPPRAAVSAPPPAPVVDVVAVPVPLPGRIVAPADRDCLIANIYYEAGGEGPDGMAAVAHVALNRLDVRPVGTTICDVIYEPHQFGWTRKVPRSKVSAQIGSSQRWQMSAIMAEAVLSERITDPTGGAHYFYSTILNRKPPRWTRKLQPIAQIGNHMFLR